MKTELKITPTFGSNQPILIVDHYKVGQRIALMQLQYFGLTAHVVNSCRQAIKAVSKHHYPLILIGWGRPECTGWTFIDFVRQQEQKRHLSTKIVAVLSHRTPGAEINVLTAGMDDYICKPITMSDMHGMLAKHLNQAA